MKKLAIATTIALATLSGCKTTTAYIDASDTSTNVVAALSYADFSKAANEMADDITNNKLMTHPQADVGGRYIVYVNDIENDTMQRLDTDQLTKSLRVKLLQSGKFLVTTAFGEDDANQASKEITKYLRLISACQAKSFSVTHLWTTATHVLSTTSK